MPPRRVRPDLPQDLALGPAGRIYIADTRNTRVVRIDDLSGAGWIAFGSYGTTEFGAMIAPKGLFVE